MFQVAYDYQQGWSDDQPLKVELPFTHEITVSPTLAKHKANGFLAGYVTMMVSSGQPTLILNEHPIWRVPAILKLPELGEVGSVGVVDVDAQSGEIILMPDEQISRMKEIAHAIAAHFSSQTTSSNK